MANDPFERDDKGFLRCKCGCEDFKVCQPPDEYETWATCVKCGAGASIHSG